MLNLKLFEINLDLDLSQRYVKKKAVKKFICM